MNDMSVVGWRFFITILYGLDSLFWYEWKGTWLSLRNLTTDLYESELKVCSLTPLVEVLHSKPAGCVSSLILAVKLLKFKFDSMNIGGGLAVLGGVTSCDCSILSVSIWDSSLGGANGEKRFEEMKILVSFFESGDEGVLGDL